jgi:hypothetical protein
MGAGNASPVEALSFAFYSSSVNVVNKQPVWLGSSICSSEYTGGNNKLSENIFCHCGPRVRITSISVCGRPKIPGRSERHVSMLVTGAANSKEPCA